jgi:hypothetical protein
MIAFTCPCCEVSSPPHSDGCTFHDDCPAEAETFDEVSALRSEIARLREERRWVPVGERLPEKYQIVVVALTPDSKGKVEVCEAVHWKGSDFETDRGNYECSHWMPMPLPPGPEGDG